MYQQNQLRKVKNNMVKMKTMSDKEFEARKPYFGVGVHEVILTSAVAGKSPTTESDFIEFSLLGEADEEGSVRMYLTEKTVERTRSILATIAVHNKEGEVEKQKVRDAFKKMTDSDDMLTEKFLAKYKDMQAWILTEEDKSAPKPNGGFYLRSNLYSYEPKPRATTIQEDIAGGKPIDLSEIPF
jgi:hypothetical protein